MCRLLNAALLSVMFVGVAHACDCVYVPPCALIHQSAAIFVGRTLDEGPGGDGPFHFQIVEAFKGLEKGATEIELQAGVCGARYKRGQRYLVLADRWPDGILFSGNCGVTISAEQAEDDIRIIRAWAQGAPAPQLQGRVAENIEDNLVRYELEEEHRPGLAGVQLLATKDGKSFRGTSDSQGFFRVPVPEPGTYSLTASYLGDTTTKPEYEFTVEAGSCSEHDIGMWTDSKVAGRIFDPEHQPVAGIPVEMEALPERRGVRPRTAVTDASGAFEFTRLPKGDYLLGVNVNGLNSEVPYDPRFYPGVIQREMAVPVRVGGPEALRDLDFQIGARRPTRLIRITAVWPDGTPVTNASVDCESPRSDDRRFMVDLISRYTNSKGEAACEVLTDREFQVEVNRLFWSASARPVQPSATRPRILVPAGSDPVSLRIAVDRMNDISDKEAPSDMSVFNDRR